MNTGPIHVGREIATCVAALKLDDDRDLDEQVRAQAGVIRKVALIAAYMHQDGEYAWVNHCADLLEQAITGPWATEVTLF